MIVRIVRIVDLQTLVFFSSRTEPISGVTQITVQSSDYYSNQDRRELPTMRHTPGTVS